MVFGHNLHLMARFEAIWTGFGIEFRRASSRRLMFSKYCLFFRGTLRGTEELFPALVIAWPGLVMAWPGLVIAWPGLGMAWPDLGMAWPGLAISWGGWENVRAMKNLKICREGQATL